jgi:hypothetical protein
MPGPTNKLALVEVRNYDFDLSRWVKVGEKWTEVHKVDGQWEIYCGQPQTRTTEACHPIRFADLPE